uniref:Putative capsid protein n=1 Tax=Ciconia boyciana Circoviridae sp. TaxID=2814997 RepID=A0A8A4XBV9_9CIRC|nr:MAG: putative capsid protein [Ciconia boyciana Circoviridae sp.]
MHVLHGRSSRWHTRHPYNKHGKYHSYNHSGHYRHGRHHTRGTQHSVAHAHTHRDDGNNVVSGVTSATIRMTVNHKLSGEYVKRTYCKTHEAYSVQNSTASGQQVPFTICELGSMHNGIADTNDQASATTLAIAGYKVIPDVAKPAQDQYPAVTNPQAQKFAMKHVELQLNITNASNTPAIVEIFFCRSKDNKGNNPTAVVGQFTQPVAHAQWANSLLRESASKGAQVFNTTGTGASGAESVLMPGARPFDSTVFRSLFKLIGAHTINLGPGASEVLNAHIKMNFKFDVAKLLEMNGASNPGVAGSTINMGLLKGGLAVFAVIRGMPAQVSGNLEFTFAPVKVGINVIRKISWLGLKIPAENYRVIMAQTSLDSVIPSASMRAEVDSDIIGTQPTITT